MSSANCWDEVIWRNRCYSVTHSISRLQYGVWSWFGNHLFTRSWQFGWYRGRMIHELFDLESYYHSSYKILLRWMVWFLRHNLKWTLSGVSSLSTSTVEERILDSESEERGVYRNSFSNSHCLEWSSSLIHSLQNSTVTRLLRAQFKPILKPTQKRNVHSGLMTRMRV